MPEINFHQIDCMDFMRGLPDNYYGLSFPDPPYGIGEDGRNNHTRGKPFGSKSKNNKGKTPARDYKAAARYDNEPPPPEYFAELKRVSKHQIIWGANHFIDNLPFAKNASCWIIWDKMNGASDFADFEMAWCSMPSAARLFHYRWNGMLQQDMKNKELRQHPNQKPVALYRWLLENYAKLGYRILDTHGGSMSSAIACHDLGFDLDICELDLDYFKAGKERFERHVNRWAGLDSMIADTNDYSNLNTGLFAQQ